MENNSNLIPGAKNLINIPEKENEIYTLVEIDSRTYAIKASDVLEIIKLIELDHFSQMPSYILGITRLGDNPCNVIDLREVFKSERVVYGLNSKIIIFKTDSKIHSIVCDRVVNIKKLESDKIHILPYQQGSNFFDGLYINDKENYYILNMSNIMKYLENNEDKFKSEDKSYIVSDEKSKAILKERREILAKISPDDISKAPLYDMGVSFLIDDSKYYINMASIKEFYRVNNSKFIKIPSTKDYILGLINIKGDYITVVDLKRLQGSSKTTVKEKSTIIILNSQEFKIGILADEICESINIDLDKISIKRQEDTRLPEFIQEGELYQIIDADKFLKDERLTVC